MTSSQITTSRTFFIFFSLVHLRSFRFLSKLVTELKNERWRGETHKVKHFFSSRSHWTIQVIKFAILWINEDSYFFCRRRVGEINGKVLSEPHMQMFKWPFPAIHLNHALTILWTFLLEMFTLTSTDLRVCYYSRHATRNLALRRHTTTSWWIEHFLMDLWR